jgi:hypothetical protein
MVDIAAKFVLAREAGDVEGAAVLCSDDCILSMPTDVFSSTTGIEACKAAFANPAPKPDTIKKDWEAEGDTVSREFEVTIAGIFTGKMKQTLTFNGEKKICKIVVAKA